MRFLKNISKITVFIFFLSLILILAFANSRQVFFSIDPFSPDNLEMGVQLPLFIIIMGALICGVVIGSLVTRINIWQKQRKSSK
ncbi:MAG: DUF1049 domain-containing protein [Parvibaculales bacterium]